MSEQKPRKAKQFWPSAKRLVGLLAPYKLALTAVFAMNAVAVVLAVFAPRVMGRAMDVIFSGAISARMPAEVSKAQAVEGLRATGQERFADMAAAMDLRPGEGIDFGHLRELIVLVLALYVVSSVLMWAQGAVLNRLTMRTVFALRERVEAKLHRLPLNYFDTRQRGDVMSRTTNDVDNVQQALQQALSQIFNAVLTLVGIIVMMFAISWQLALVALLAIPLTGLAMGVVGTRSQAQFAAQWKATGEVNGQVEEAFSGHEVALIFGRTDELHREFDERNERLAVAASKAQFLANSMHPLMQFISYLSYVAIAVLGGLRVASGHMTLGDATAFIQYSRQFNQPLGELAGMMQMVQSGVASAERIFELLDAEEEVADVRDDAASASERAHGPSGVPRRPFLIHRRALDPGPKLARCTGADRRDCGANRRWQDHAGQPAHALLRRGRGRDFPRRPRHPHLEARNTAQPSRDGIARRGALRRHDHGKYSLRAARRDGRRGHRCGNGHVRGPVRARPARWLRHGGGPGRRCAFGR